MDINKYIASGILEDYVLGLIPPTEAQAVEKNLLQYPELKVELGKIEDALATYAQAKAKPMPVGLSKQILQSIDNLEGNTQSDTANSAAKPAASKNTSNTLSIALGITLLSSLLGSFYFYQQQQNLQTQLVTVETQSTNLNNQLTTLQLACDQNIQQLQEENAILKNPTYQRIQLNGTPKAQNAIAMVHYNTITDKTYLDIGSLPAAPADKDYQLWAIIDGQPTDMKVIDMVLAANGLLEVAHINNVQAFAVTLETKGGNPSPNLEELYVIGNV